MQNPSDMSLNGDLSLRVSLNTQEMPWQTSPSGGVTRKRLHLVGSAEQGQVTSLVEFAPGSSFPMHPHPEGEEVLVLNGVFSDHTGDWGKGSYLLNPEGFDHAPFTKEGCLLFVKLRQYPGTERPHVTIDTEVMVWEDLHAGVARKVLYQDAAYPESMVLERWDSGAELGPQLYPDGAEIFTLSGEWCDENGTYTEGSWLRLPCGAYHNPQAVSQSTLYIKRGGVQALRSGA